jgi:hypothetical protein
VFVNEENNSAKSVVHASGDNGVEVRYVAYCDILGFSNKILSDFDRTLGVYKDFGKSMAEFAVKEVRATMYSDAILVTAMLLGKVLSAVQQLWFLALRNDLMIRGAITKGRYWEQRQGNHLLVASDALVRAVKLEQSVGVPAVVIADDVEIPDELWQRRFVVSPFETPLLHFRDRNIVNPFNTFWGKSAASRTTELMNESPTHRDKYLWFLALHEAAATGQELIPPAILARFQRDGILRRRA